MRKHIPYFWHFSPGKQVIHPNQIKTVQEEFSPSPDRVNWATELIAAFVEHQKLGKVHCINIISFKLKLEHQTTCLGYSGKANELMNCYHF